MRERWWSRRALSLHAVALVWVGGCLFAGYWQATRALGGNDLSYAYSVEWPLFAIFGVAAWWVLVHADPEQSGLRGQLARARRPTGDEPPPVAPPERRREEEDEELAAYNDRLAALAAEDRPKTWRRS
ncbi:MAG TPA: hypothetical protein VK277_16370 [Acidimicrobiales bacterium]|nr:hypothetical protein [Acidimicrobiales bacterium]